MISVSMISVSIISVSPDSSRSSPGRGRLGGRDGRFKEGLRQNFSDWLASFGKAVTKTGDVDRRGILEEKLFIEADPGGGQRPPPEKNQNLYEI